jgi:hypothetical protein
VISSATSGVTINSASAVVKLRNLTINGNGNSSDGVLISAAAAVTIENCVIENFNGAGGAGINANLPSSLQLNVTDTLVANNSGGGVNGGIVVLPTGSGTVSFVFERIRVENNPNGGIVVNGSGGTGAVKGFIRDSVVSGTTGGNAIVATTLANTSPVAVSVYRSHVVGNLTGILSSTAAAVILGNSTIQANNTAVSSSSGGAIFSYGNNDINDNGTFGSAPTVIAQH